MTGTHGADGEAAAYMDALRVLVARSDVGDRVRVTHDDGSPVVLYRVESGEEAAGASSGIVGLVGEVAAVVADDDLGVSALDLVAVAVDGDEAAGTAWTIKTDVATGVVDGRRSAREFGAALDRTQRPVEFDAPPF